MVTHLARAHETHLLLDAAHDVLHLLWNGQVTGWEGIERKEEEKQGRGKKKKIKKDKWTNKNRSISRSRVKNPAEQFIVSLCRSYTLLSSRSMACMFSLVATLSGVRSLVSSMFRRRRGMPRLPRASARAERKWMSEREKIIMTNKN